MKSSVAILTGGTSSERAIALLSAGNVAAALASRFETTIFDLPNDLERFLGERGSFIAAVPVFHGKGGEDGTIQGFLKTLGVPFIFSDVAAHAIGMNKWITKELAEASGLATSPGRLVRAGETMPYEQPVVVKPLDGGSSIGVSIARSQPELDAALRSALALSSTALVETFVSGDEYTVAMVDVQGKPTALPLIQIKSKHAFFDYESKYAADLVDEICPAPAPPELAARLANAGLTAHAMIGARHISRSDFIVDQNGKIWFLEINTIPGATLNSLVPKAMRAANLDFGELLAEWINSVT